VQFRRGAPPGGRVLGARYVITGLSAQAQTEPSSTLSRLHRPSETSMTGTPVKKARFGLFQGGKRRVDGTRGWSRWAAAAVWVLSFVSPATSRDFSLAAEGQKLTSSSSSGPAMGQVWPGALAGGAADAAAGGWLVAVAGGGRPVLAGPGSWPGKAAGSCRRLHRPPLSDSVACGRGLVGADRHDSRGGPALRCVPPGPGADCRTAAGTAGGRGGGGGRRRA